MVAGVNITVPLRFGVANVSYRLALDVSSLQTVRCHDGGAKFCVRWPRGDKVVAGESRHMQYRECDMFRKKYYLKSLQVVSKQPMSFPG